MYACVTPGIKVVPRNVPRGYAGIDQRSTMGGTAHSSLRSGQRIGWRWKGFVVSLSRWFEIKEKLAWLQQTKRSMIIQ